MQFLEGPTLLHEATGQIIEQFRMAWRRGLVAEIVRRRDEPFAEVMQPDAIDQDTRSERIALVRAGLRQFKPAAAILEHRPSRSGQHLEKSARDDLAMVLGFPRMKIGESFGVALSLRTGARAGVPGATNSNMSQAVSLPPTLFPL